MPTGRFQVRVVRTGKRPCLEITRDRTVRRWSVPSGVDRMKKTGRLLPTRSQLPSSVRNFTANPRGSRVASEESRPPMTVEKRTETRVFFPFAWKSLARVYVDAGSSPMVPYASNSPWATKPRACTTRSGIRSRSKWLA